MTYADESTLESGQLNPQGFVAKPGHGRRSLTQSRGGQERIMGAFIQLDHDLAVAYADRGRYIQKVAEELLGRGLGIRAADFLRQQAVQGTGHQCDLQIEVDF